MAASIAIACISCCNSVVVSVCLFVHLSQPSTDLSPGEIETLTKCLVFCDKILFCWMRGFPSNEGVKDGYPPKE